MYVQEKNNDKDSVRIKEDKNDRLYVRINSNFKEELLKKAKKEKKSLSTYILDVVRTYYESDNVNVRTSEGSKGPINDDDVRTDDHILQEKIKRLKIEHKILLKLIKPFAQRGINVNLDNDEIEIVKKLAEEVFNA